MGTVDVAGGETVPVDLTLPLESLAPGAYALRVTVSDGAHSTVRSIGILVK